MISAEDPSTYAANFWGRWLLDTLEDTLDQAASDGVPCDALGMASAFIAFGTQLGVHAGGVSSEDMARYLRAVAASFDAGLPFLPALAWFDVEG
ncbi:hypothetical protein [Azospirillum isscasi]|uniref:Tetracyclin repressor-like C-terminal domain-containing protein n=1 Tax=Azospirillum isscasi TaxID=3053926 RepID=A0ABU0WQH2_9PROT|nr:hypothetical protein [Azospirillum isscasi]MDQ2106382.1 hypothetical protein [Azospirillum isscasi]